jgi:hypothetical protein
MNKGLQALQGGGDMSYRHFAVMLENLLGVYVKVPSLRQVYLGNIDAANCNNSNEPATTSNGAGGRSVVFGRTIELRGQSYIIVPQSDNFRVIHYMTRSIEIIKRREQGLPQDEDIEIMKICVDEIYAATPEALGDIKKNFQKVLLDLYTSEFEADKLWPYRHEMRETMSTWVKDMA